jgi:phytoene desaturase
VQCILTDDVTEFIMPAKQEFEVTGVQLEDGRTFLADAVICNADAAHLYKDLLEAQFDPRAKNLEPSLSGFVMLLGVDGQTPNLEHHNMFFSKNYPLEFSQIFKDLQPASDPSIYVAISSKSDPSQAPSGMENWFVLVNAPSTGRVNWQEQSEAYSNLILEKLAGYGVEIRDRIRVKCVMTPTDLEHRYRTFRGGIYGTSSNTINSAFLRPQNRSRKVRGLYLASGSAHPGGGLPLVMLSGKLAVEMLIQDFC